MVFGPVTITKVAFRVYVCKNCGTEKLISTNHTGDCLDYCPECSWKMRWRKDGRYSDPTAEEMSFPMFGHMYRPFKYVREIENGKN